MFSKTEKIRILKYFHNGHFTIFFYIFKKTNQVLFAKIQTPALKWMHICTQTIIYNQVLDTLNVMMNIKLYS